MPSPGPQNTLPLAHDPETDTLYLSDGTSLWTVNPATGAGTLVGPHGTGTIVSGLAVQPTPPPSCLIGLDLGVSLWNVDSQSGAGSFPRVTGPSRYGGLAKSPSGELFALRDSPGAELHWIDEPTGAVTIIGPLGIEVETGGLDFDPISGELYGVGGSALPQVDSELFVVDTVTGAATLVGPVVDECNNRINASALAFDVWGNLFVLKASSSPPEVYHVNPIDGSVLDRVPLPGVGVSFDGGMDFDDFTGLLYLSHAGVLYRASPYTGISIPMGPTPVSMALEVDGTCGILPLPVPTLSATPVISSWP